MIRSIMFDTIKMPALLKTDQVTLTKSQGHQQRYFCVQLNGGYNHTKFKKYRFNDESEVKVSEVALHMFTV